MKKLVSLLTVVLFAGVMMAQTYTVAGDNTDLFGTSWTPSNTDNDMVLSDGIYKWEKENMTLGAGMVKFKVCEDHAWTVAYPAKDYELTIPESGIYTITITYNPEGNVVEGVATKTGDAVVIPSIAMHGNFLGGWADTENFAIAEGNATASLTMTIAKGNYEFGMRIGGSGNWTSNGVAFSRTNNSAVVVSGSGNMTLAADAAGDYTFTWTYETNTLSIAFPEEGDDPGDDPGDNPGGDPAEHTYTVAGDNTDLFGEAWKPENASNDMVLSDGIYKWEKENMTLGAGMVKFKVCEDHAWTVAYPAENYELTIPESGIYTITITYNPEGNVVAGVATKTGGAVVIPSIAMHGNFLGGWADTENFAIAEGDATASLTLTIAEGNYEFGMRIGGSGNWTSNGAAFSRENNSAVIEAGSGNMTLAADVAGEYTFTWTYETNTLTITFPMGTAIDHVGAAENAVKMIENGQLVIIKNGVRYDAQGAILR